MFDANFPFGAAAGLAPPGVGRFLGAIRGEGVLG